MLPPNIVYGHHHSLPCSSSNNGNNNNNNSQLFHYQAPLNFCPPMVYVDGIWHRMPIPYPGNFMVPEPQFFFSPPPPSLENVFDYNNAIFVEDDLPEQPTQDNGHGLKRLTSAEITEEDLAFLKSKAKVLSNLEEPSPPISLKSNFSPSTYSSPSNSHHFSPIFLSPFPPNLIRQKLSQPPPRKRVAVPKRSNAKNPTKTSPLIKRTYRKSYNQDELLPKVIVPRPRKQPPPLRVSSLDNSQGFVGFCGVLNVNPYYSGCPGRITTTTDHIGHTYFICANCGTRRRYLEESNFKTNVFAVC